MDQHCNRRLSQLSNHLKPCVLVTETCNATDTTGKLLKGQVSIITGAGQGIGEGRSVVVITYFSIALIFNNC